MSFYFIRFFRNTPFALSMASGARRRAYFPHSPLSLQRSKMTIHNTLRSPKRTIPYPRPDGFEFIQEATIQTVAIKRPLIVKTNHLKFHRTLRNYHAAPLLLRVGDSY